MIVFIHVTRVTSDLASACNMPSYLSSYRFSLGLSERLHVKIDLGSRGGPDMPKRSRRNEENTLLADRSRGPRLRRRFRGQHGFREEHQQEMSARIYAIG